MKKLGFGVIFVVLFLLSLSALLALDAFGYDVIRSGLLLPLGIAVLGVSFLLKRGVRFLGLVFTFGGIYLILRELDLLTSPVRKLALPILLAALAVYILARALGRGHGSNYDYSPKSGATDNASYSPFPPEHSESSSESGGAQASGFSQTGTSDSYEAPDYTAVFTSYIAKNSSQSLRRCTIASIFGSIKVSLVASRPSDSGASINAFAMFGYAELIVPSGWNVSVIGTPVLGSVDDTRISREAAPDAPLVEIRATSIFGGIKIKN